MLKCTVRYQKMCITFVRISRTSIFSKHKFIIILLFKPRLNETQVFYTQKCYQPHLTNQRGLHLPHSFHGIQYINRTHEPHGNHVLKARHLSPHYLNDRDLIWSINYNGPLRLSRRWSRHRLASRSTPKAPHWILTSLSWELTSNARVRKPSFIRTRENLLFVRMKPTPVAVDPELMSNKSQLYKNRSHTS